MTKVVVVDFPERAPCRLKGAYDVRELTTIWNGGNQELDVAGADVLFIFGQYTDTSSATVHINVRQQVSALLRNGALIVTFLNNAKTFHVQNLLNIPEGIFLGNSVQDPGNSTVITNTAFDDIFSRFGNKLTAGKNLGFPDSRQLEGKYKITLLLRNDEGGCVSCLVTVPTSAGACVYLPFVESPGLVMQAILDTVLPSLCPHLLFDAKSQWLRLDPYLMPSVLSIREKERATRQEYASVLDQLAREYEMEWARVQAVWTPLLLATGDALKAAVMRALEFIGFVVEDVDSYWTAKGMTSRQKEEDLWAVEAPGPAHPACAGLRVVEVKSSGRGAASESDYGAITKYLNRRKTEFHNPDLYGLFVMNHFYQRPAAERPSAFSAAMEKDAVHDRVTLVTTWDLFRIVQQLLGGGIEKEEARRRLSSVGIVKA